MKEGGPSFCLSNPPHLVGDGDVICHQCGALAQDAVIGSYQVKRFLRSERGNQAYLATQKGHVQPVLMKLFPPDPASQHLWKRAWQEMHLLAELHHRSILPTLDCIVWNPGISVATGFAKWPLAPSEESRVFLVVTYQYAPVTLQHLMQNKAPISLQATRVYSGRLLRIVEQITAALVLAHSLGAVHGALAPGNVLLNAQLDHAWLADFGLARLQIPRPPFLAPELVPVSRVCEQRRDIASYWEAITEASDQYALAVLCYQLFLHAVPPQTFKRILPVFQRALQPEPPLRFQKISDFSSTLVAAFMSGQPFGQASDPSLSGDLVQELQEGGTVSPLSSADKAAEVSPSPSLQQADQLEQLAGKHFTVHDYQEAVQAYLQTLRLEPTRTSALSGLADSYFALERYIDALEAYGRVLDLDPNNAEAWFNQATVFELLGRADQAVHGYERAEQLRAEAARRLK